VSLAKGEERFHLVERGMHLHQELSDFVHASFQRWERTGETGIKIQEKD
jgi:hypothetical protein